ncbi:formin-A-like protein [Carex littledalei]|uniref:Formin-A-like protein n=1 Tax=Carex littledalei TaxID=544730 RepID=A0A833V6N2_9POAL|nr:formin-A-like protein [Carex littledalei]
MNFRGSMGVRIISGCCAIPLRSKGTLSYVPSISELEPRDARFGKEPDPTPVPLQDHKLKDSLNRTLAALTESLKLEARHSDPYLTMGDKVYTLVISVDLSCWRCRQAIQDYLCQMQGKQCMRIVAIVYDEKNNAVLVSGPFDPEQLKRQLLCKFPKIINGIDIREPPKPKPPDEEKPKPPPKDENKEKFMKKCLEEYEEISKCIEKCKKECEEKCRTECENKFKCKCKCKCKCDCDCDCEKKKEPPKAPPKEQPTETPIKPPPPPKEPPKEQPKPPMYPWPPQVTMVCCARPCPCLSSWSNNYRCCSCGVESWPGCGPGWGSGPSHGGRPQWSNCESSQPPNIIFHESAEPSCSIM